VTVAEDAYSTSPSARPSSGSSGARSVPRRPRRRGDDDRVGDERFAARAEPPTAVRALHPLDRGAEADHALGERARDGVDERRHPIRRRDEEAVARAGRGRRIARRRAEAEDEAPVTPLDVAEARHGGREREALGVGRVDAADERLGDPLQRFAAEPPADEVGEALVGGR